MATFSSESLTQDSDEINEMHCEECERSSRGYANAVAFCVDCVEYICANCQNYHRRHFKSHKVQNSDRMPQDFYFEKCATHCKQLIKFYCTECNKEACKECKNKEHLNCGKVYHLPTIASGVQNCDELTDLKKHIDQLLDRLKDMENLLSAKNEETDKLMEMAAKECKEHRDKLMTDYKQLHQEVIVNFKKKLEDTTGSIKTRAELVQELCEKERKFEEKIRKAKMNIQDEIDKTNKNFQLLKLEHLNLIKNLKALGADIEQTLKSGQNCKLFIKMKYTQHLCKSLYQTIGQVHHACLQCYKLKTYEIPTTLLSLENQTTFFSLEKVHASAVEKKVTFDFDINCQFENTVRRHTLVVLSEHTLLESDWEMYRIVIYAVEKSLGKCLYNIKFDAKPYSMCKVADNKIAVTFPEESKIRLITFTDDMKVSNITAIPVNGHYEGIAYSTNYLVNTDWNLGSVKMLSMFGQIEKEIDKDKNGQNLLCLSSHSQLTVSPDNTRVYFSDPRDHIVTCLTFDGKVKAIFKGDQMTKPDQLAIDEHGSVYVYGWNTSVVNQLSCDLIKVKTLIDGSHGNVTLLKLRH